MLKIVCKTTAGESLAGRGTGREVILTKPLFASISTISAATLEINGTITASKSMGIDVLFKRLVQDRRPPNGSKDP